MRSREHTHRCVKCNTPFPCGGTLERNYDGWPEVICLAYHELSINRCDECEALEQAEIAAENAKEAEDDSETEAA